MGHREGKEVVTRESEGGCLVTANTRVTLEPMPCPRCGRNLQVLANGGTTYLRCESEPPKCGIIVPSATAMAWSTEKRMEKDKTREIRSGRVAGEGEGKERSGVVAR